MSRYLTPIITTASGFAMYAAGSRREWLLALIVVMSIGLAVQIRREDTRAQPGAPS